MATTTTTTVLGCGCMCLAAVGRRRTSSPFFASTSLSFLATASALGVTAPVNRLGGSGKSKSLTNSGHVEVREAVVRAAGRGDENRDDAGVIKDMELYLDDLSLEYDSVWDTKPAWCQPWTIIGTGLGVIIASWLLLHNIFLTGGATFAISLWWLSFLYAYPLAYSEMIAERRKMVEDGREDTYGRKRVE